MNCYPFIEAEKAQRRNVKRACELLKVSRSAYYAARAGTAVGRGTRRTPSWPRRSRRSTRSRRAATALPRVHAQLRAAGQRHSPQAGRPADARRRACRAGRRSGGRRPRSPTRPPRRGPDLIRRDFTADASKLNTRWCGDITYIATWEGWLYLATVIDIASRRVVG